jgi:N-acetylmuramic acid 6-phosphate etherase
MVGPDFDALTTEAQNPRTAALDAMPTFELLAAMNDEDRGVAEAVREQLPAIAAAVDAIAARLRAGGRLIHVGAGTSGRLGVLDAAECPPTFSSPPGQVVGVIAGGSAALQTAVEGAEDDAAAGAAALRALGVAAADAVVGLSASGCTPYVLGALRHARQAGAATVAVVCNRGSEIAAAAELPIEVVVGAEVLAGSTRLKAGTAQKLVLNMLSTGAFVRRHKVYGNLMVDLQATNSKLVARCRRILQQAAGVDATAAERQLQRCAGDLKAAIVALRLGLEPAAAAARLAAHDGSVRAALAAR